MMRGLTPEQWRRIEDLFDQALEIAPEQRESWLAEACGDDEDLRVRVSELLKNEEEAGSRALIEPVNVLVAGALNFEDREIGQRLGPYELLEQIGRGGMGTVYKARRVDAEYRSTVAIKLVRPGMNSEFVLSRFRRERQTLAKLSHPNIARLLDGGTTSEGIPYIVMEYISGAVISDYCSARKLSVNERVALFLPICTAVEYAHRNFIIHRDIKPGNILVDETGTPKLLDFGICKLFLADQLEPGTTVDMTLTQGVGLMTPDYASPEQVLGEVISPVSDVYSLGLVLYELLTEQLAHHIEKYTPLGIQEAVCRKEILPPSAAAIPPVLSAALLGDLDNILMKALQKEPVRRYESAAAFASDLERYLKDEPVLARPDTALYRAKKFVRRNRLAVGAAAAIMLAVGIGGGVAFQQSIIAREQEQQARELARNGLFEVFDQVREMPGSTATREKIVESASKYLEKLASSNPSDPVVLKELADGYKRVGDLEGGDEMGGNLGNPAGAVANYRRSSEYLDQVLERNSRDLHALKARVRLQMDIAGLDGKLGGPRMALKDYDQAVISARALLHQYPADSEAMYMVADLLMNTGRKQRDANDLVSSEKSTLESLDLFARLATASPADPQAIGSLAAAESAVGMIQSSLGRLDGALQHFRKAVERNQQTVQMDPNVVTFRRNLMIAYSHLGEVQGNPEFPNLGQVAAAEAAYREMLKLAREISSADPKDARAAMDLGFAELRLAAVLPTVRVAEKKQLLENSLEILRTQMARTLGGVVITLNAAMAESYLGDAYRETAMPGEALKHYAESLSLAESTLESGHNLAPVTIVRSAVELARLRVQAGQHIQALNLLKHAQSIAQEQNEQSGVNADGPVSIGNRVLIPRVQGAFAEVYKQIGDLQLAEQYRAKALAQWKDLSGRAEFDARFRREMEALQSRH